ncbi:hypothetical protein [Sphingobium yanoikuyae]|uniref:hypothetical protein n=1 Tax=Sphingobium yanoikuyae TaxID=13690 RepID=UPI0026E9B28E|nr:hypothetical protein [Sphingobium yanoikuyae]
MTYAEVDPDSEFRWLFYGLPFAVMIGFIGLLIFGAEPAPAPPNEAASGCYRTANGPSFRLNRDGALFEGSDRPVSYRLERAKIGIVLSIDALIELQQDGQEMRFLQTPGDGGRVYPFVVRSGAKSYYTMNEQSLERVQIIGSNGQRFEYRREAIHLCDGI